MQALLLNFSIPYLQFFRRVYLLFYKEKTVGLFLFCIMLFFSLAIEIIK